MEEDGLRIMKKRKVSPDDCNRKKQLTIKANSVHSRCPAEDALLGVKVEEGGAKVRVILAEGWENVLPQKGEDDPGSFIMWDDDNIAATVIDFNAAIVAGAAPPAWLNVAVGANPITIPALKASILAHVRATAGGGGVIGNAIIAPNDYTQYGRVTTCLSLIGVEPFFVQHAQCPIGRHYSLADCRANTTAVADPIVAPPNGLGVAVFA